MRHVDVNDQGTDGGALVSVHAAEFVVATHCGPCGHEADKSARGSHSYIYSPAGRSVYSASVAQLLVDSLVTQFAIASATGFSGLWTLA